MLQIKGAQRNILATTPPPPRSIKEININFLNVWKRTFMTKNKFFTPPPPPQGKSLKPANTLNFLNSAWLVPWICGLLIHFVYSIYEPSFFIWIPEAKSRLKIRPCLFGRLKKSNHFCGNFIVQYWCEIIVDFVCG